jgi:hypothetical protein
MPIFPVPSYALASRRLAAVTPQSCIDTVFNQARRYQFASLQDNNPVVAARHNGYAVALADTLAMMATEDEVDAVTGMSLQKLVNETHESQREFETKVMDMVDKLKAMGIPVPGLGGSDSQAPLVTTWEAAGFLIGATIGGIGLWLKSPMMQAFGGSFASFAVFATIARKVG